GVKDRGTMNARHRIHHALPAAPAALWAYTFFAAAFSIADLVILSLLRGTLRAAVAPYAGSVPSMNYAFTIFAAFALIFQRERRRREMVRFLGITVQLLLQIAYGLYLVLQPSSQDFGN